MWDDGDKELETAQETNICYPYLSAQLPLKNFHSAIEIVSFVMKRQIRSSRTPQRGLHIEGVKNIGRRRNRWQRQRQSAKTKRTREDRRWFRGAREQGEVRVWSRRS